MKPEDDKLVETMVTRCLRNAEFINAHAEKKSSPTEGPFEITQQLAMLMAMLCLSEKLRKKIAKKDPIKLEVAQAEGWPELCSSDVKDTVTPLLWSEQINMLRHGLAHGNIRLFGNKSGEITDVEVWNVPPYQKIRTWGTKISANELMDMIRFIEKQLGRSASSS